MMVKSGLEFSILKFNQPLQRYLLTCQANSAFLCIFFCTGQQQILRGSMNFKIKNSIPLFIVIFKPRMSILRHFREKIHRMKTSDKAPMCTAVFCCSLPIHTYMHAGRRRYAAGAAIKSPPHRGGECVSHHPVLYGNPSRRHSATFSANYHKYRVIFSKLS